MPALSNITFDAVDAQAQSYFWADVFGYPRSVIEGEFKQMLLDGGLDEADMGKRGVAEDPTGVGPRFFFHQVPEAKTVKNRMHIDIRTVPDRIATHEEVDAEVARIVALGATIFRKHDSRWGPFPEYHYVMQDPEGNEFCIQ